MQQESSAAGPQTAAAGGTLSIKDERTGEKFELAITDDTVKAIDLRQVKVRKEDFGMMSYDPGYTNTAAGRSAITFIDGAKGILNYRGYPIDQLAASSNFLETCCLLLDGELPSAARLQEFSQAVSGAATPPDWFGPLHDAQRADSPPMAMLMSGMAALGAEFPDGSEVDDPACRQVQIHRLLGLTPVLAAFGYRRRAGLPYVGPDPALSYAANFLHMVHGDEYKPNEALETALDVLLILHADHEQNCSTTAVKNIASSKADPYASVTAGVAALYGPLHGRANQAVLEMLDLIPTLADVPDFVQKCKDGKRRLMGFGHRVYKSYDPRATIIKELAYKVFEVTGKSPKLEIALELERIALEDPYFVERKLYPNVDFYSGMIYAAMGFEPRMFPVFFAMGRMGGWLAHWNEFMDDPEFKIVRPRQVFTGAARRDYVPMASR